MKIVCLFAQRNEGYPGQYAPELLEAIDEYGDDDNPDYMNEAEDKADADRDLVRARRIEIEISDKDFDAAFNPEKKAIKGTVLQPKETL